MSQFKLAQLFEYRNVTPSSLSPGNLIYFKYKSPNGVHDKSPLVYVLEKKFDKIFGLNLHYDMDELQELTENIQNKIDSFLENKWFSKHPEKRKELREKKMDFDKSLIEQKELLDFNRSVNKKDLETFQLLSKDMSVMRCYLYSRMNNVSKLVWKL